MRIYTSSSCLGCLFVSPIEVSTFSRHIQHKHCFSNLDMKTDDDDRRIEGNCLRS